MMSETRARSSRRFVGQADEDQAADHLCRDLLQAEARHVEVLAVRGGVAQPTVCGVRPVVVAAHQVAHGALRVGEDARTAMPADIVQGSNLFVVIADDDDRVRPEVDGDVVACVGDLAF